MVAAGRHYDAVMPQQRPAVQIDDAPRNVVAASAWPRLPNQFHPCARALELRPYGNSPNMPRAAPAPVIESDLSNLRRPLVGAKYHRPAQEGIPVALRGDKKYPATLDDRIGGNSEARCRQALQCLARRPGVARQLGGVWLQPPLSPCAADRSTMAGTRSPGRSSRFHSTVLHRQVLRITIGRTALPASRTASSARGSGGIVVRRGGQQRQRGRATSPACPSGQTSA